MWLLVVRLGHEEQMFPNWHLCCPGVHITEKSSFAFCVDIESETLPLGFHSLKLYNGFGCSYSNYSPQAAIFCTKAVALTPGRGTWGQWTGHW